MLKYIIIDKDKASRTALVKCLSQFGHLTLLQSSPSIKDASVTIRENKTDLLFITLPAPIEELLTLITTIKYDKPSLVILSSERKYGVMAFDLDAVGFILKPVTTESIGKALTKIIGVEHSEEITASPSTLFIRDKKNYHKVNLKDIFLVEAAEDYVLIHTNQRRHIVYERIKNMHTRLPDADFVRIHNSYIVRLDRIKEFDVDGVTVEDKIIPISHTYKKAFMEKLKLIQS